MKNLRLTLITALIALFAIQASAQVHVDISVFASIPVAPNITLNVGVSTPQPRYDAIWIDGYWTFDNRSRSYAWVQGYWVLPPYSGAVWMPGYWNYTGRGYIWVDAAWCPRDYVIPYGYYTGRYDYYGRPVYYHKPAHHHEHGYAYRYDHRQEYRGGGYSSDSRYNNERSGRSTSGKPEGRYSNSGYNSSSDRNSGNYNSGRSSGNYNSGRNSGNSGDYNRNDRTSTTPGRSENVIPSRGGNVNSSSASSGRGATVSPSSSSSRSSGSDSGSGSSSRSRSSESTSSSRRR